jgi:hypothetical protein
MRPVAHKLWGSVVQATYLARWAVGPAEPGIVRVPVPRALWPRSLDEVTDWERRYGGRCRLVFAASYERGGSLPFLGPHNLVAVVIEGPVAAHRTVAHNAPATADQRLAGFVTAAARICARAWAEAALHYEEST